MVNFDKLGKVSRSKTTGRTYKTVSYAEAEKYWPDLLKANRAAYDMLQEANAALASVISECAGFPVSLRFQSYGITIDVAKPETTKAPSANMSDWRAEREAALPASKLIKAA